MPNDKKQFLLEFCEFWNPTDQGKCYFKTMNGQDRQGWISEIFEDTFEYLDSGPEARDEPYILSINNIDENSFAYWDEKLRKWMDYKNGKYKLIKAPLHLKQLNV